MRWLNRALCALNRHRWHLIYQDEQEIIYSCGRDHGADLCPAIHTIPQR
jgi:hypothetical protein